MLLRSYLAVLDACGTVPYSFRTTADTANAAASVDIAALTSPNYGFVLPVTIY